MPRRVDGPVGLGLEESDARALARKVEGVIWRGVAAVNLSLVAFALITLLLVLPRPERRPFSSLVLTLVGFGLGTMFVLAPVGIGMFIRLVRRSTSWLMEARPPTREEATATTRLPLRGGLLALGIWLSGAVALGAILLSYYPLRVALPRIGIGGSLLAVTALILTFLFEEQAIGPILARIPAEVRTFESRSRIFTRILLAWSVGATLPLAVVALRPEKIGLSPLQWVLLVAGSAVSLALVYYAARSFSRPLGELRRAIRFVRAGDLSATVEADSTGEVGQLQVTFNEMVEGLRDRDRLQDLFGRHVGREVAEEARRRAGSLGGDVCEASALFVDLIDSTSLAQRMAPGEVVAILNRFFDVVVRVVGDHRGWVNKFHGDGALCVFGVPEPDPDHRTQALAAAAALRAQIATLVDEIPGLDAAIGVSSGLVVAGNIGASARHEYTVIGDPVNEAARLADQAKLRQSRVLASTATVSATGEAKKRWIKAGSVVLRGRTASTIVYEPAPIKLPKTMAGRSAMEPD
ncbi:MAG: adenylate/guanylate cyclase domain-containing protein [Actinomycetota bacterium]